MPQYDRYLIAQLAQIFGLVALVLVSVYWVNLAVSLFEELIAEGQTARVVLEFGLLNLPNVIRLVLPVAAFVATVYALQRMIGDSELVVLQAAGCSPLRLARPVVMFGMAVAGLVAVLTTVLVPASRAELAQRQAAVANDLTARFLRDGAFLHPAEGITVFIGEITERGELVDVLLADARAEGRATLYTAARALLVTGEGQGPRIVMFEGLAQTLSAEGARLATTRFRDLTYDFATLLPGAAGLSADLRAQPTAALLAARAGAPPALRARLQAELHGRLSTPLLSLAGALIGFTLMMAGSFSRFGPWRQVLGAVVGLVGLQMAYNAAADAARGDAGQWPLLYLPPLATVVLALGALALGGRARRLRRPAPAPGPAGAPA